MSTPAPEPAPQPAPQPKPPRRFLTTPAAILLSGAMIAAAILLHPPPGLSVADRYDFVATGKEYGKSLVHSYADALDLAGNEIATGTRMSEAQSLMQKTWNDKRVAEFNRLVTPSLNHIMPEGADPSSASQRNAIAAAFHDLSKGVRSACDARSHWLGR